ncbi:MAG: AbrB/MazE/SpoVT family DNA-binding domain-containing protein, partial [Nitrososphaerales archaeon]
MKVKVARRHQITIPEHVREDAGIRVGDTVDVRSEGGKVIVEKISDNWGSVMKETRGVWKTHPVFKEMKDAVEIS